MRVCLISREYPPETGWGGIGTFMYHLAHGLKELGHEVEVVSLTGKMEGATDSTIPVHRVDPIKIKDDRGLINFCLPTSRPMLEEVSALWSKFLEIHSQRPFDIAEAPEHFAEGVFLAASKCVPLVIRLHTPHSKLLAERFHNFKPSFDHQFLALAERIAMSSADRLVSPSEDLAGYVSTDLNYPLDQIAIIRNPVDAERFSPEGPKALSQNGDPTVLFVGRLEERKGVYHLARAIPEVLSRVKNAKFVIIGSDTMTSKGHTSVRTELSESLSAAGVSEAVQFIPHVPLSEIANYYRSADLLVLPSLYDNAPCTVIEAMSCGTPVVGTSAGGTSEYVLHDQCGLIVPPADSDALADALTKLLTDKETRERMGRNARSRALDNFTREIMTRQTVELYGTAIQRWRDTQGTALYKRNPQQLLSDFAGLINSFQETLYDLLFVNSLTFRFEHWGRKAGRNPGQALGRLLGRSAQGRSEL